MLTLERPIVWLDCETHSKKPDARICELGLIKLAPDASVREWESLINPGVPIEPGATEVHHITDEMVQGKPTFEQLAESLAYGFSSCDFSGYNVRFDLGVLFKEFKRVKVKWTYEGAYVVDPLRLWQILRPRKLADAVREFCDREPTEAHRALGDTQDVRDVLYGMLAKFPELPRTVQGLHDMCVDPTRLDPDGRFAWDAGVAVCNFGKHKGVPMRKVPRDYYQWMLDAGDFSPEATALARNALMGSFPTSKGESEKLL